MQRLEPAEGFIFLSSCSPNSEPQVEAWSRPVGELREGADLKKNISRNKENEKENRNVG